MNDAMDPSPAQAIGRRQSAEAPIRTEPAAQLAATLDLDDAPSDGAPLPPGWHWMYFNPFPACSELGPDGHPKRGGFLPETGLPRRMWAGGRIFYPGQLRIGAAARKDSRILNVAEKSGRAGRLCFVTVQHRISQDGELCIEEEQDIVYREPPDPAATPPAPSAAPDGAEWSEEIVPDPVLLFRYSALTSNGHRIHYDQPYATREEGYPDLVVHGPLIATLLQGLATRCRPGLHLQHFSFRGMAPLFVTRPFRIEAKRGEAPDDLSLWARGPEGELAMRAEALF
ncbi:MaoC family dehydratase N-terminal domain-containing protein [Psychromarinibacter sp. C21-152]|uniref:MaoC family dehydratase N-terminal domain-containing protein n=1 Tax=Psychromarinibacter sediminicola TaxID=3033385 RepID=A0AAE3NND1_9RHOB|nr:MaoC family dehydratase N-terminal domain-containing protein [Psychromarinibacter sediminicola]MDF0599141.1 MaoC family dehydratase N-terminal domain-containing protein [Psychromarinibacter sediminicola]